MSHIKKIINEVWSCNRIVIVTCKQANGSVVRHLIYLIIRFIIISSYHIEQQ